MLKTAARNIGSALLIAFIVFAMFEVTLRIFPSLIPPQALLYFNETLRGPIAERIGLKTESRSRELPRDDQGPPTLTIYKPNVTIGHLKPDEKFGAVDVTADAQGFCNPPSMPYDKEHIDLIAIGDSFTWCTTVPPEKAWPALLHKELGASAYNLGQGGKGLYDYIQILKNFGLEKNPDVVIMAAFGGNDLASARHYWSYRNGKGAVEKDTVRDCGEDSFLCTAYVKSLNSIIGEHSYAFNIALVSMRIGRAALIESQKEEDREVTNSSYFIEGEDERIEMKRQSVGNKFDTAKAVIEGSISFELFDEALETFKELSGEHDFLPVLIYIPPGFVTYGDYVTFEDPTYGDVRTEFSTRQREYFAKKAKELDIVFLDTVPHLKDAAEDFRSGTRLLYFPTNLHLTQHGHAVIAEAILSNVQEIAEEIAQNEN